MRGMRVGIIAKAKHGDLMEALEARGWNQRQGAEFLGVDQTTFSKLINLMWVPKEFSPELTIKLYELTGKTTEELFPEWARQKDFLNMPKIGRRVVEVTPLMLRGASIPHLLPTPEEASSAAEVKEIIEKSLHETLSPREEKVIRDHTMGGATLEEVSRDLCLTPARIQQIANRALKKLRSQARILRCCL